MKSVLISIKPQWCEKIANGSKTIEVRKSAPKEVPFKCYIYCTKDKYEWLYRVDNNGYGKAQSWHGKVIGEFICNEVVECHYKQENCFSHYDVSVMEMACLSLNEIHDYGKGKTLYGWHISDLKIYDKPRELSEFSPICRYKNDDGSCQYRKVDCLYQQRDYNTDESVNIVTCGKSITRPPQSYMFVEELGE